MIETYPNRVITIVDTQFLDDNQKNHISLLKKGYIIDSREEYGFKQLTNILFVCLVYNTNIKNIY